MWDAVTMINGHIFKWYKFGDGIELEICDRCNLQRSVDRERRLCKPVKREEVTDEK